MSTPDYYDAYGPAAQRDDDDMPLPATFTNIRGILSTLLMFPLFQQLMDLATGNVDTEESGKQLHFQ